MPSHCNVCKHFSATGSIGPNSGDCRRCAPNALDVNNLSSAKQYQINLSMGALTDALQDGTRVELYPAQNVAATPLANLAPVASPGAGINGDGVFPFCIPVTRNLIGITFAAARANVAAAAPASAVSVKIVVCQVGGPTNIVTTTYNVAVPAAKVHGTGYATDDFLFGSLIIADPLAHYQTPLVGAYVDIDTGAADDLVGEVRSPFVSLLFADYAAISNPWSAIYDGAVDFCGKFEPAIPGLPKNRCYDCEYFVLSESVAPAGWCHFNAPHGIGYRSLPGIGSTPLYDFIFPYIIDGKVVDCGDFKPATRAPYPE